MGFYVGVSWCPLWGWGDSVEGLSPAQRLSSLGVLLTSSMSTPTWSSGQKWTRPASLQSSLTPQGCGGCPLLLFWAPESTTTAAVC